MWIKSWRLNPIHPAWQKMWLSGVGWGIEGLGGSRWWGVGVGRKLWRQRQEGNRIMCKWGEEWNSDTEAEEERKEWGVAHNRLYW